MIRKLLVVALGLLVGGVALAAAQSADAAVTHHKSSHRASRATSRSHAKRSTARAKSHHSSRKHTAHHVSRSSRTSKTTHRA